MNYLCITLKMITSTHDHLEEYILAVELQQILWLLRDKSKKSVCLLDKSNIPFQAFNHFMEETISPYSVKMPSSPLLCLIALLSPA